MNAGTVSTAVLENSKTVSTAMLGNSKTVSKAMLGNSERQPGVPVGFFKHIDTLCLRRLADCVSLIEE